MYTYYVLTKVIESRDVAASCLRRPPQLRVVIEESDFDHYFRVVPAEKTREGDDTCRGRGARTLACTMAMNIDFVGTVVGSAILRCTNCACAKLYSARKSKVEENSGKNPPFCQNQNREAFLFDVPFQFVDFLLAKIFLAVDNHQSSVLCACVCSFMYLVCGFFF